MDLTTLAIAVLIGLGLLGADAVVYSGSVEVQVTAAPGIEKLAVSEQTLAGEFEEALDEITSTPSVVRPPELRSSRDQGLGMALAEAVNVQNVAFALQSEFGYRPDQLRFSLYMEDGAVRALVSGKSHLGMRFQQVMSPAPGEQFMAFVQRCALWGASQLAPYSAALYLLQKHSTDLDFTDVVALVEHAKAMLPPTPTSFDRALFDNLLGLVALFKNDPKAARAAFAAAMADDPTDPVGFLNAAFTDLQLDESQKAADRMEQLLRLAPPANPILHASAYTTWGAARLGLHDPKGAHQLLAEATRIDPTSATAFGLWAEAEREEGEVAEAAELERKALESSATFENYAEVAALYFHLSWKDNEPVIRNRFANPGVVSFH
jgi:tetratricopeptide (TPR) repeat protein